MAQYAELLKDSARRISRRGMATLSERRRSMADGVFVILYGMVILWGIVKMEEIR